MSTDKETIYSEYKSGMTYSAIAIKYTMTRNQIAGIIGRYRKSMPQPANIEKTLTDWANGKTCLYITGDGEDRQFCGCAKEKGYPYCAVHKVKCYRPKKTQ